MNSRAMCSHVPHSRRKRCTAVRLGVRSHDSDTECRGREIPASYTPPNAIGASSADKGNRRATNTCTAEKAPRAESLPRAGMSGGLEFHCSELHSPTNKYSTTGSGTSLLQSTPVFIGPSARNTCNITYTSSELLKRINGILYFGNPSIV